MQKKRAELFQGASLTACVAALLCLTASLAFAQKKPLASSQRSASALPDKFSRYRHYTMEQGLSSNWVTDMAQDEDGFLWFGTVEGLNRFDGERFTPFFHRADANGLPTDRITQVLALPGHRLLIGTEKGLCLLHTRRLAFDSIALPVRETFAKTDVYIYKLYRARNGQIWVGTNVGVFVLDGQLRVARYYWTTLPTGEPSADVLTHGFLELPDGTVAANPKEKFGPLQPWQIIDFQKQTTARLAVQLPGCGVLDTARMGNCTLWDGRNNFWYTAGGTKSRGALYHFDWETRRTKVLLANRQTQIQSLNRGQYFNPLLLPDSLLLLQQYFGPLLLYNLRDGSTAELPGWNTSWPDGKMIASFLDRNGNLWLCQRDEGVYFFTLKNLPATPMLALNAAHQKTMAASGVAETWFGFIGLEHAGKWVVSSNNGGLYSMDKAGLGVRGPILDNPFKAYAYVSAFAPDRGDTLWMSTLDGLYWYSASRNTNGVLQTRYRGLDSLDDRFLCRDHHGRIWGRVRGNGVCYFDTRSRQLRHFPSKGANPLFPLRSATACAEGPDGDMWFSYGEEEKYIVRWRRATGDFEKIAPKNPTGMFCTKAFKLIADPHGNLWLYNNDGWFVMDVQSLQVQSFGKDNGLITNDPNGACLDLDGNLWFATAYGLSRYDPRNGQLRTFYETDGLLSNCIANVELLDTARNILFVSTNRGMCLFEPDKVGAAAPAPPTIITGLQVSDHAVSPPQSGLLALSHHQNDLRIEFTGVNFISGPNNRYQYSMELEGRPANWRDAGTDNFANFLNLAPDRYVFRARTANSDGIWGIEAATLHIVLYPPWWQTWTFRLSLLAALATLGWWLYRRQIATIEDREKEKTQLRQQMADLEMKALRSQMNPHFIFNALNSVQHFILKNDTREASRYLTKFARLMRLILENSESPVVPLAREIELLRYYTEMEALRFNHRFSFEFQIDETLHPESVAVPGMLLQPHIENAIWHGIMHKEGNGQLWVRFIKTGDHTLVCEIEDNGVGRVRAAEIEKDRPKHHRSTGLANIRQRLELLKAQLADDIRFHLEDLYDENGAATGTKVVVRMPLLQG